MTTGARRGTKSALTVAGLASVALLTAASASWIPAVGGGALRAPSSVAVVTDDTVPVSVLVSRTLFESSPTAVVVGESATPAQVRSAADTARDGGVPMFQLTPAATDAVKDELARLGVVNAVTVGDVPDLGVARGGSAAPASGATRDRLDGPIVLLADAGPDAVATSDAAGAQTADMPAPDPRSSGRAVSLLKQSPNAAVRAIGSGFGSDEQLRERIELARTQPQLPGGGQLMFPGRRVVALYGSPGAPELGPLARQSIQASVARAKKLAASYQPLSAQPVVPGFEIIVSVAASEPGDDKMYTTIMDPQAVRPWIDAARDAGVYVTLDLQPGRMDFLKQAEKFRDLLAEPHVGLALDPEWRLKPDQVHLEQIGAVDPAEVNRVSAWLADLVRSKGLPQKAFVLHQFDADMLGDRSKINTRHPELAVVVHADGHGTPPVKMGTWRRIVNGLPPAPDVWMGWKNFYRDDKPIFSPARTMAVTPVPWFISYQ